jgi:hypothetical protein
MTRAFGTSAALLLICGTSLGAPPKSGLPYKITLGADKRLCQRLLKTIAPIHFKDFLFGRLSESLAVQEWQTTSVEWTDKAGNRTPRDFRYRRFDIDNDGSPEVVVANRYMIRSTEYDSWDVLSNSEFAAIQRDGIVWDQYGPERIDGSQVEFADADGFGMSLTTFMVPWTYAKRNYVIFQEVYFGHPERRASPRYVVLAEYKRDPYQDGGRWQPMKPVCGIRDSK